MSDDFQSAWSGGDGSPSNPYSAAPIEDIGANVQVAGDIESIRNVHLSHEASIKSIGTLYILGAIFLIPLGLFLLIRPLVRGNGFGTGPETLVVLLVGLGYLAVGLLQVFTAFGLRKLSPSARTPAIVLSVVGLIGFPIGTLMSCYFLYLLLSRKGKVVLSERYQAIVAQTPHIKYKTSIIVWAFLGVLILLLILGLSAAFFV